VNINIRSVSNPRPQISGSELLVLLREADVAAARVARRLQLPASDRDDVRQDILVDLLGRLRSFDPDRGTFGAFVGTIAGHRATRLTDRIRRRLASSSTLSLHQAGGCEWTVAEGRGAFANNTPSVDCTSEIEQRLDLVQALRELRPAELSLCVKLTEYSPTEISRSGACSRATLYRQLKKIRMRLLREGAS
jgi:RNA polymerase sigma factor (sigma-70 family)